MKCVRNIIERIFSQLDSSSPGYGDDVAYEGACHYPEAYALILTAALKSGRTSLATTCGQWLISNATLERSGLTGWGLPFGFKAFGEDENPPHTIYGITTAFVVSGLLDLVEAHGNDAAFDCAQAALLQYEDFFDGRHFYYSQHRHDNLMVPNVDAMLAGQFARFAVMVRKQTSTAASAPYEEIAKKVYRNLLSVMSTDGSWPYSEGRMKKNDILHHAYIVRGLKDVENACNLTDDRMAAANRYMNQYLTNRRAREMPLPSMRRRILESLGIRPFPDARLWGVGAWLAATNGQLLIGNSRLIRILSRYRNEDSYDCLPGLGKSSIRQTAHLLWGLTSIPSALHTKAQA